MSNWELKLKSFLNTSEIILHSNSNLKSSTKISVFASILASIRIGYDEGEHRGHEGEHRGHEGEHRGHKGEHRGHEGEHRGHEGEHRGHEGEHRGHEGEHRGHEGEHRGHEGEHRGHEGERKAERCERRRIVRLREEKRAPKMASTSLKKSHSIRALLLRLLLSRACLYFCF